MHLVKEVMTDYDVPASIWKLEDLRFNENKNGNGLYNCECNLRLYVNQTAIAIDNCKISYDNLTENEINGSTITAIIGRIMASNIVDGVEKNTFQTSHCGIVAFQNATIE